jgi:hypothetical protein
VFSHLLTFLLSVLSSVVAWLLTVKAGDSFKHKSWSRILLILAVFGFVFVVLTVLQNVTAQPPQQQSPATLGPVTTAKNATVRRPEPAPKKVEPRNPVKYVGDSAATPGEFTTESYKLTVDSFQRSGATAITSVTLESLSNREIYFTIMRDCYLVDENGERWTMEGYDPARFIEGGTSIVPRTKIKSKFSFIALDSTAGSQFTLICAEASPRYGRKIVIRGLAIQ